MKKTAEPRTQNLFETYRNLYTISDVMVSLQRACRNLELQAHDIQCRNSHYEGTAILLTTMFLNALADVELHLTLLTDYYQCDHEDNLNNLITKSIKDYHIS